MIDPYHKLTVIRSKAIIEGNRSLRPIQEDNLETIVKAEKKKEKQIKKQNNNDNTKNK